jgi:Beta-lactamase enzyme family
VPPVWRTLPAVLAALALLPAAASAAAPQRWRSGVAAADAYARSRAGTVTFAVRTERGLAGRSAGTAFESASVAKAMLMVAYLRQPAVRRRALGPADRNLLTPMIRWSSNRDASRVNHLLGPGALDRLADRVGMTAFTTVPECWSCSRVTARDQTRLMLAIDRLLPRRHRTYGMGLLARVVPRQRWGVALAAPAGWRLYFKGGWTRAVDHQVALLTRGRARVSVAVLTSGSPSHAYATETLRGVFLRLLRPLRRSAA